MATWMPNTIVLDADGMIIKYIGDASMHVLNASTTIPDHVATLLTQDRHMLKAVEKFNEKLEKDGRSHWDGGWH